MLPKVYEVAIDYRGTTWASALEKTFALEKSIALLAKRTGVPVYLHQLAESTIGQPPVILIECPESFADTLKQVPGVYSVQYLPPGKKTIRRIDAPQIEPPQTQRPPIKKKRDFNL